MLGSVTRTAWRLDALVSGQCVEGRCAMRGEEFTLAACITLLVYSASHG